MTISTWSSLMRRGAPLRGSSNNAATPPATNRDRHLPTVVFVRRSSRATWLLKQPSLHRNTIAARTASPWAVLRRVVQRSNVARYDCHLHQLGGWFAARGVRVAQSPDCATRVEGIRVPGGLKT